MIDFKGLGLFDGILVCHYTAEKQQILDKLQKNSVFQVVPLSDDESIVIN